ncbi:MAG: hypothetical protein HY985_13805 [Magnetospirillum sp.]|nr:hypothetical protein [Magnetospirillum sp.]
MDVEFHYYMTYLIATRAGFGAKDAFVIAYASQYVDDNDVVFEVDKDKASCFRNYISQTMNILKPKATLLRIYPLFHFIPGAPDAESAWRKDGKMHWLNTTPNSENAIAVLDAALATGNLYRIGVASHSYVDTWAHQNFVGYYDSFNSMTGPLDACTPDIGHADAGHNPDWPALVWKDERMQAERIDNRARFLDAAACLLAKLARCADAGMGEDEIGRRQGALRADLDAAIGVRDQSNRDVKARIARYRDLATTAAYGRAELPAYDGEAWLDAALNEDIRGLKDWSDSLLARIDPLTDIYTWKDPTAYTATDWYRFQQAVIDHQNTAWAILSQRNLRGLQLPQL